MAIGLTIEHTAAFLLALAMVAFFVSGAAFVFNSMVITRDAITRRVDRIRIQPVLPGKGGPSEVSAADANHTGQKTTDNLAAHEIVRQMAALGIPADHAPAAFFALRAAIAAVFGLGAALFAYASAQNGLQSAAGLGILLAALGWFVPYAAIHLLVARRMQAIEAGLPEALELLVVAVEAGLALEDGIGHIVTELSRSRPALAEELALTSADLKILPSRDVALANLAKRVNIPSVRSIVTTLSQTMRYGTPLVQALRTVAAELRNDALIKLEERANRLPVFLTVPMMLFILPSIFLIIGGPAIIRLVDILFR